MYAKCKCGKVWNVSIKAEIPKDGYKCPVCRSKNLKEKEKKYGQH